MLKRIGRWLVAPVETPRIFRTLTLVTLVLFVFCVHRMRERDEIFLSAARSYSDDNANAVMSLALSSLQSLQQAAQKSDTVLAKAIVSLRDEVRENSALALSESARLNGEFRSLRDLLKSETDRARAAEREIAQSLGFPIELWDHAMESVVRINVTDGMYSAAGTGFCAAEGYIVTAAHVATPEFPPRYDETGKPVPTEVRVSISRSTYEFATMVVVMCEVVAVDPDLDVAVLKYDPSQIHLVPCKIRKASPAGGLTVAAIGYRIGLPYLSMTLGHSIHEHPVFPSGGRFYLYTAPSMFGNSGGPVFDVETHEVIGISVWLASAFGHPIEHMGFYSPNTAIRDLLQKAGVDVG